MSNTYSVVFSTRSSTPFGNLYLPNFHDDTFTSLDAALEYTISRFDVYEGDVIRVGIYYSVSEKEIKILQLGNIMYEMKNSDKGFKTYYDRDQEIWYFDKADQDKIQSYNTEIYKHNMITEIYKTI